MKDLGPVDTSITTVRPYFNGAKAETRRMGASKINSKTGKHFHPQNAFIRHKNGPVVRNAIGVPIVPRDLTAGQHIVPTSAPTGVKAGDGLVKAGRGVSTVGVFRANARAGRTASPGNGGAISGTGFPHRGFVPAALGGQAKMTGSLGGSLVRPKY
jgi:hypothetical protein